MILIFFFFDQETRAQRSRVTSTSHMFYKVSVLSSQEKGKVTGREELLTWSSRNTGVCVQAQVYVCKHVCVCKHMCVCACVTSLSNCMEILSCSN